MEQQQQQQQGVLAHADSSFLSVQAVAKTLAMAAKLSAGRGGNGSLGDVTVEDLQNAAEEALRESSRNMQENQPAGQPIYEGGFPQGAAHDYLSDFLNDFQLSFGRTYGGTSGSSIRTAHGDFVDAPASSTYTAAYPQAAPAPQFAQTNANVPQVPGTLPETQSRSMQQLLYSPSLRLMSVPNAQAPSQGEAAWPQQRPTPAGAYEIPPTFNEVLGGGLSNILSMDDPTALLLSSADDDQCLRVLNWLEGKGSDSGRSLANLSVSQLQESASTAFQRIYSSAQAAVPAAQEAVDASAPAPPTSHPTVAAPLNVDAASLDPAQNAKQNERPKRNRSRDEDDRAPKTNRFARMLSGTFQKLFISSSSSSGEKSRVNSKAIDRSNAEVKPCSPYPNTEAPSDTLEACLNGVNWENNSWEQPEYNKVAIDAINLDTGALEVNHAPQHQPDQANVNTATEVVWSERSKTWKVVPKDVSSI